MAVLNLDNLPEPDDGLSGWSFDPDNPPDTFTEAHLGRMSLGDVELCADPETSPLNATQQASFDEVYRQWTAEMAASIRRMLTPVLPKLTTNYDSIVASVLPRVPTAAELGFDAKALTRVKVPPVLDVQFDSTWKRLVSDLDLASELASHLRVPSPASPPAPSELTGSGEAQVDQADSDRDDAGDGAVDDEAGEITDATAGSEESVDGGGVARPLPGMTKADAVAGTRTVGHDVTLSGLVERVERSAEQLAFIGALNETMQRQADLSARGSVFYVVVGLATTLGGVATLVGLDTWTQRIGAAVATVLLAGVALFAFLRVRHRQLSAS